MSDAGDVMQGLEDRPWVRAADAGARLAGKRAIVTGAGTRGGIPIGIGEAIAIVFATQGAQVAVVDISPELAQRTVDIIGQLGGDAVALTADVTDEAQVARAVGDAVDAFGGLDTLVNNAAISGGGRSPELVALDEWDAVLRLNLDAAMLCARHAIPHLKAAGGGAIVNLTSVAAARAMGSGAYAASKAALLAASRDWAYENGHHNIRVNCLAPGHAFTPMGQGGDERIREMRRRAGMLVDEASAWDIAWPAVFLASEESRAITAIELTVDSGTTAMPPLGWSFLEMRRDSSPH
jgi:NAD(P)-dependent dehydrogenase (short-subunit alcohol dehydrogenase family)